MKRRNAESGKMRRPIKRTKIAEGVYGNSLLYLKFVMLWATVVLADYMLEFRFEFLWPFWMMLRSLYDSFKYQGLAFSVFFICIALTSDMICFFFIPLQYIFFAASTYVWVQYVWYSFADKGICLPTVVICCVLVYVEGAMRAGSRGPPSGMELCRPLAAHCVGYPVVTLGFGVKSYVGHRLRLRRQRRVREENDFYFQLMRDAIPESALEQSPQPAKDSKEPTKESTECSNGECGAGAGDARHLNGSVRRRRPEHHAPTNHEHKQLDKEKQERCIREQQRVAAHAQSNGAAGGAGADEPGDRHEHISRSTTRSKCEKKEASTLKEEKRKSKNKDKDKDNKDSDSHKSTEQTKEQIVKEQVVESTKENHIRNHKECNLVKEKEKERREEKERDKEREREMREKEKERERERERERELREARECVEELKRTKAELAAARSSEAEARRALAACAAAERQRRAEYQQLKQAHAALQHKVSQWRLGERAALERRLGEERRARTHAEQQLLRQRHAGAQTAPASPTPTHTNMPNGECESGWWGCRSSTTTQTAAQSSEGAALRRELRRALERAEQLQRDLQHAQDQVRTLEARQEESGSPRGRLAGACAALQERTAHLERSLSAETRVKLDLLSALGEAKRQMQIQEGQISKQDKEIEELKAQMLAVMPTEYVSPVNKSMSNFRMENSVNSMLDPNASVYTPKQQLCSDA